MVISDPQDTECLNLTNSLKVFDHFVGMTLKGLRLKGIRPEMLYKKE